MKLSSLGQFSIEAVPATENPETFYVSLGAENRLEVINMVTNKDETVDQFCLRIKGMMRALMNSQPRNMVPVTVPEDTKSAQTWDEQKEAMKKGKNV